jgi:RNA polymerase sigma-70 factor (ECF subfamily)
MDETFDEAYRAYGAAIFAYLVRMTGDRALAEELCQETFVRFLRHRPGIRATNGTLAPWLFRVATRLVFDSRRRRSFLPLDREPAIEADVPGAAGDREIARCVGREVESLPVDLKATFILRARQDLTFREIASATGVSERAAKDRFRRARDRLLRRLGPLLREIST